MFNFIKAVGSEVAHIFAEDDEGSPYAGGTPGTNSNAQSGSSALPGAGSDPATQTAGGGAPTGEPFAWGPQSAAAITPAANPQRLPPPSGPSTLSPSPGLPSPSRTTGEEGGTDVGGPLGPAPAGKWNSAGLGGLPPSSASSFMTPAAPGGASDLPVVPASSVIEFGGPRSPLPPPPPAGQGQQQATTASAARSPFGTGGGAHADAAGGGGPSPWGPTAASPSPSDNSGGPSRAYPPPGSPPPPTAMPPSGTPERETGGGGRDPSGTGTAAARFVGERVLKTGGGGGETGGEPPGWETGDIGDGEGDPYRSPIAEPGGGRRGVLGTRTGGSFSQPEGERGNHTAAEYQPLEPTAGTSASPFQRGGLWHQGGGGDGGEGRDGIDPLTPFGARGGGGGGTQAVVSPCRPDPFVLPSAVRVGGGDDMSGCADGGPQVPSRGGIGGHASMSSHGSTRGQDATLSGTPMGSRGAPQQQEEEQANIGGFPSSSSSASSPPPGVPEFSPVPGAAPTHPPDAVLPSEELSPQEAPNRRDPFASSTNGVSLGDGGDLSGAPHDEDTNKKEQEDSSPGQWGAPAPGASAAPPHSSPDRLAVTGGLPGGVGGGPPSPLSPSPSLSDPQHGPVVQFQRGGGAAVNGSPAQQHTSTQRPDTNNPELQEPMGVPPQSPSRDRDAADPSEGRTTHSPSVPTPRPDRTSMPSPRPQTQTNGQPQEPPGGGVENGVRTQEEGEQRAPPSAPAHSNGSGSPELQERVQALMAENAEVRRHYQMAIEALQHRDAQIQQFNSDLHQWRNFHASSGDMMRSMQEQHGELTATVQERERMLAEEAKRSEDLRSEVRSLYSQLEDVRTEAEQSRRQVQTLEEICREGERQRERDRENAREAESEETDSLRQENEELKLSLQRLNDALEELQYQRDTERTRLEGEVASSRSEASAVRRELEKSAEAHKEAVSLREQMQTSKEEAEAANLRSAKFEADNATLNQAVEQLLQRLHGQAEEKEHLVDRRVLIGVMQQYGHNRHNSRRREEIFALMCDVLGLSVAEKEALGVLPQKPSNFAAPNSERGGRLVDQFVDFLDEEAGGP